MWPTAQATESTDEPDVRHWFLRHIIATQYKALQSTDVIIVLILSSNLPLGLLGIVTQKALRQMNLKVSRNETSESPQAIWTLFPQAPIQWVVRGTFSSGTKAAGSCEV